VCVCTIGRKSVSGSSKKTTTTPIKKRKTIESTCKYENKTPTVDDQSTAGKVEVGAIVNDRRKILFIIATLAIKITSENPNQTNQMVRQPGNLSIQPQK
jgi:hypothetical protein